MSCNKTPMYINKHIPVKKIKRVLTNDENEQNEDNAYMGKEDII